MAAAFAGTERYDYDPVGRLVRVIDEQGRVTEYVYDAAGNILQVINSGAGSALPPSIVSINPTQIRAGSSAAATITGANFNGVTITPDHVGLDISAFARTATQLTFNLNVAKDVPQ